MAWAILEFSAGQDRKYQKGRITALHLAASFEFPDCLQFLVNDAESIWKKTRTVLHGKTQDDNVPTDFLLSGGDKTGYTALVYAILHKKIVAAKKLLELSKKKGKHFPNMSYLLRTNIGEQR